MKYNFSAGPGCLPLPVLKTVQKNFLDFESTGFSIVETSHRSQEFETILNNAQNDLAKLLSIPDNYKILFMQGGATLQFSAIFYNLCGDSNKPLDYLITGAWSEKAAKEAKRLGANVNIVFNTASTGHDGSIPAMDDWKLSQDPEYIFYVDNETIHGVEFPIDFVDELSKKGVPIICDMSSNIISRKFDVSKYGCIFAGAQKNIGPAGVTIVIIREDLIRETNLKTPIMLDYKTFADSNSLYNTPPTFGIYVSGLVFKWCLSLGGIEAIEAMNKERADMVYSAIESSDGYYVCNVKTEYRSRMNIVFRIGSGSTEEGLFINAAQDHGLMQLKGHRSRRNFNFASIYEQMENHKKPKLNILTNITRSSGRIERKHSPLNPNLQQPEELKNIPISPRTAESQEIPSIQKPIRRHSFASVNTNPNDLDFDSSILSSCHSSSSFISSFSAIHTPPRNISLENNSMDPHSKPFLSRRSSLFLDTFTPSPRREPQIDFQDSVSEAQDHSDSEFDPSTNKSYLYYTQKISNFIHKLSTSLPKPPKWQAQSVTKNISKSKSFKKSRKFRLQSGYKSDIDSGSESTNLSQSLKSKYDIYSQTTNPQDSFLFHVAIEKSRQAKIHYWNRKKDIKWRSWRHTQNQNSSSLSPTKIKKSTTSSSAHGSPQGSNRSLSPLFTLEDEDFDIPDDSSFISSTISKPEIFSTHKRALSPLRPLGLNIDNSISPARKSIIFQSITNLSNGRSLSDGGNIEHLDDFSLLRKALVNAKKDCDREIDYIISQLNIFAEDILSNRNQNEEYYGLSTSPEGTRPYSVLSPNIDIEWMDSLTEMIDVAQRILFTDVFQYLDPKKCKKTVKELLKLKNQWNKRAHDVYLRYAVKLLLAFSGISRIVEYLEADDKLLACAEVVFLNSSKSKVSKQSISKSQSNDNLSPSENTFFDQMARKKELSSVSNIKNIPISNSGPAESLNPSKQKLWSNEEFKSLAQEGISMNVIMEIQQDLTINFISASCMLVFGYDSKDIKAGSEIPFLPKDSSGFQLFKAAVSKLYEMDNISMDVSFKAKRIDNLGLLMEGRGIRISKSNHSIWILKPIARLGNEWKNYKQESKESINTEIQEKNLLKESTENVDIDLALCRICERTIPILLFENHSTVCSDFHRIEMDFSLVQESLGLIKEQLEKQFEFLRAETEMENLEIESTPETLCEQRFYIVCLDQLGAFTYSLKSLLEEIMDENNSEISQAKKRFDLDQELNFLPIKRMDESAFPTESSLYPSKNYFFETEDMKNVNMELKSIGDNLLNMLKRFLEIWMCLPEHIYNLREETIRYHDAFLQEENIKLDILKCLEENSTENLITDKFAEYKETSPPASNKNSLNNHGSSDYTDSGSVVESAFSNASPTEKNDEKLIAKGILKSSRKSVRNPRIVINTKKSSDVGAFNSSNITSNSPEILDSAELESPHSSQLFNTAISNRSAIPSIKDYEIVKPISKGAFGSVYLAKKKITGDYFAIKVLKKADMIAKNQITNIKAERMILTQLDSPFVVRLYYSFQSRNHLYLVMEYLNGGDCASLLKAFGRFDEPWSRQYVSEMILGLEFLHSKGIVHRDMKPDNLLIDSTGHLRLTDFGLSRMGFIDRRSKGLGDIIRKTQDKGKEISSNSDTFSNSQNLSFIAGSPLSHVSFPKSHHRKNSTASVTSMKSFTSQESGSLLKEEEKEHIFLGTPDYLSPECIMGMGQEACVDWWAVGVILYEFLYGIPPFNAESPQLIFENILAGKIDWHEEEIDISEEAKSLMDGLMKPDIPKRLGTLHINQVKSHLWLKDVIWDSILNQEPYFIPKIKVAEDTDYFDTRGVQEQNFEEEAMDEKESATTALKPKLRNGIIHISEENLEGSNDKTESEFGDFIYKNLPLLEKANQKLVKRLQSGFSGADIVKSRSLLLKRQSNSSEASLSNLMKAFSLKNKSVSGAGVSDSETDSITLESMPTRRTRQLSAPLRSRNPSEMNRRPNISPLASFAMNRHGPRAKIQESPKLEIMDVLIADDNPVACKVMETYLTKLGCRCVIVNNGSDTIGATMSEVQFDLIFIDARISAINGIMVSRIIKSSNNLNQGVPIVVMTGIEQTYDQIQEFDDVISKPVSIKTLSHVLNAIRGDPFSPRGFTF